MIIKDKISWFIPSRLIKCVLWLRRSLATEKKFNIGLEAGSKPELHTVIAINPDNDSLIVCNGYKDEDYIELALLAQKKWAG